MKPVLRSTFTWLASTLLLGICGAQPTAALSADEILARHAEAKGGLAAWRKVSSLRLAGDFTSFSKSGPFTIERATPDLFRLDHTTPEGKRFVLAWDGKIAWMIDPWAGFDWAVEMDTAEREVLLQDKDFAGPLLDATAKGNKVALVGPADFDGIPCHHLEVTRPDGGREQWYVSTETFLEVARVALGADFGSPVDEARTYFFDFRKVGGLVIPHRIEKEYSIRHRLWEVAKVEIDPAIPAERFRFERSAAMQALAGLVGDWTVKIESRPFPRAPWSETATTATITEAFFGALLETTFSFDGGGRQQVVRNTWTHDRANGTYLETVFDNQSFTPDLLRGQLADGKLVVSNLETGTAAVAGGQTFHSRVTTSELQPDSFKRTIESSSDGGATWNETQRFTFTRKATGG